jgi:hypothetical protein
MVNLPIRHIGKQGKVEKVTERCLAVLPQAPIAGAEGNTARLLLGSGDIWLRSCYLQLPDYLRSWHNGTIR